MQFQQAGVACSSVSGRNLIVTCSPTSIFKEWGEKERAFLSWTSRDKLSWSHRDAAHITKGHLLRYSCSRTCGVHNVVSIAGGFPQGGFPLCHLEYCIA